jgi:hypothetical protein
MDAYKTILQQQQKGESTMADIGTKYMNELQIPYRPSELPPHSIHGVGTDRIYVL